MKYKICVCLFVINLFMLSNLNAQDIDAARNRNVCKKLQGNVVFYAIFVDTKDTKPWTEFDINSTLDSIRLSMDWIQQKARDNNINLTIDLAYFKESEVIPIAKDLPEQSFVESTLFPNKIAVNKLNEWGDYIAKRAGLLLNIIPKDGAKIIKPKDKERLIATLRNEYRSESVALFYLLNNYYKEDFSYALNISSDEEIEYAIISYKNPTVIAGKFLSLFGALDIYTYSKRSKNKEFFEKELSNDITANPNKYIDELEISSFTQYLIGWKNNLNEKYKILSDNN